MHIQTTDFYRAPNISALIFTTMQPQLFLFEEEDENNSRSVALQTDLPAPETDAADVILTDSSSGGNKLVSSLADEEEAIGNNNPFAEVQQKQQDKVDLLLLMTASKKRGRKSFKDMDVEAILPEVPDDDTLYQKQYYSTRIVADWFGVTPSQLRAWENEFDILKPKRNGKGDRFFRPEDVKNIKTIYHLIRVRKFTVQGAKQYLEENRKKLQTTMQLTESLNKFKQFLVELKAISG